MIINTIKTLRIHDRCLELLKNEIDQGGYVCQKKDNYLSPSNLYLPIRGLRLYRNVRVQEFGGIMFEKWKLVKDGKSWLRELTHLWSNLVKAMGVTPTRKVLPRSCPNIVLSLLAQNIKLENYP
ncbi:MAG: hypothetical protein ABI045_04735 [Flavobacteriales bacterium]